MFRESSRARSQSRAPSAVFDDSVVYELDSPIPLYCRSHSVAPQQQDSDADDKRERAVSPYHSPVPDVQRTTLTAASNGTSQRPPAAATSSLARVASARDTAVTPKRNAARSQPRREAVAAPFAGDVTPFVKKIEEERRQLAAEAAEREREEKELASKARKEAEAARKELADAARAKETKTGARPAADVEAPAVANLSSRATATAAAATATATTPKAKATRCTALKAVDRAMALPLETPAKLGGKRRGGEADDDAPPTPPIGVKHGMRRNHAMTDASTDTALRTPEPTASAKSKGAKRAAGPKVGTKLQLAARPAAAVGTKKPFNGPSHRRSRSRRRRHDSDDDDNVDWTSSEGEAEIEAPPPQPSRAAKPTAPPPPSALPSAPPAVRATAATSSLSMPREPVIVRRSTQVRTMRRVESEPPEWDALANHVSSVATSSAAAVAKPPPPLAAGGATSPAKKGATRRRPREPSVDEAPRPSYGHRPPSDAFSALIRSQVLGTDGEELGALQADAPSPKRGNRRGKDAARGDDDVLELAAAPSAHRVGPNAFVPAAAAARASSTSLLTTAAAKLPPQPTTRGRRKDHSVTFSASTAAPRPQMATTAGQPNPIDESNPLVAFFKAAFPSSCVLPSSSLSRAASAAANGASRALSLPTAIGRRRGVRL